MGRHVQWATVMIDGTLYSRRARSRALALESAVAHALRFRAEHGHPSRPITCAYGWRETIRTLPNGLERSVNGPSHDLTADAQRIASAWGYRAPYGMGH